MSKKGAMAAVGISRRKQAHGSSSLDGGRGWDHGWCSSAVREMRSALKDEIAAQLYRPGPNRRRVNTDVRAPRPRPPRAAAVRAAPAAAAVQAPPAVELAAVAAIPAAAAEEDEALPLAEAPVFFRASKPAARFKKVGTQPHTSVRQ